MAMSPSTLGLREGNVSTSVGSSLPRYWRLSFCISSLQVTKMTTSPRSPTARCAFPANSASARSRTSGSSCTRRSIFRSSTNGRARAALPYHGSKNLLSDAILWWRFSRRHLRQRCFPLDAGGRRPPIAAARGREAVAVLDLQRQRQLFIAPFIVVVRPDDSLHQVMAHHVSLIEVAEPDPFHVAHDLDCLHHSAPACIRQIDLGNVTSDDRLGVEAEAGHEHLHLLRGGVLRFIENDKRIVQRASAHERDGSDLNDVLLQVAIHLVGFEHVVQRVV